MVLVTGATGILGRVIVLELLKRGRRVRAAKRSSSNLAEVRHSFRFYVEDPDEYFDRIEWVDVDFNDIFSLKNALLDVREVYHCAAVVSFHPKNRSEMYRTNIEGTKQLLYACEGSSVKKFCHISSVAVLDEKSENGLLDEDSAYNPKLPHSAYAVSKQFSEMEVWRASAEGLDVVILNPGVIIGSGNWQNSSGTFFPSMARSGFSFTGTTAYVDVRDVAKIAVELMAKNIFDERFVIVSENRSFIDLANIVRRKLGLKPAEPVPAAALKVAPIISALLGWCFPLLRMGTRANIEAVTTKTNFSNQKIRAALGHDFIPVEESIDFHLKNYLSDNQPKTPKR